MEAASLALLLKQTLDPATREVAEAELKKVHKIIGFCPGLLQVVMTSTVDNAVRQAGVIYFKNLVSSSWVAKEAPEPSPSALASGSVPPVNPELTFTIHEQDKALVRDNIVQATVQSPDVIRIQMAVCVSMIIKHDFPHNWPQVVDQVSIYLQAPEPVNWIGALTCLYQLVKNYEYKKKEERAPLHDAMNLLLPMIYEILLRAIPDQSAQITEVKKIILKIYFALTQYILPMDLISRDFFINWMGLLRQIVEQDIPPEVGEGVDEEDKPSLIWWKQKKWALHILSRLFERYGSPGNVSSEYKDWSEWYLKTFSPGILASILKVLDAFRRGIYVSPRVMQLGLNYVNTGVSHALTWKLIKPHILEIIKDVIFPLMSYTEKDAELWDSDPYEYVRVKFDIFEDFVSPITAAQTVLHSVCKKRKDVLPKTMGMLLAIVQDGSTTPSQKDGALHMIGTMADILLKKKIYKDQMEQFLLNIVFPEFNSPHGHLRARACWMLHYFADVKYKNPNVLGQSFQLTIDSLLKPGEEVPVKVEAAIALQMMLSSQGINTTKPFVEPRIREITLELLKIIRETENDDLTTVMQKIVCSYTEQLIPVAVDMCKHLVETFAQVLEGSDQDEKAITAMGLLNTMETILAVMEDHEELHAQLEPVVLQAVHHIFTNSIMEFYEEAFSLTYDLTTTKISDNMWEMFKIIYQVFERDGVDYFVDMMPALHNYVTVDTEAFLTRGGAQREFPTMVFNMCKKMLLEADPGEDPECHAAKLLEVIILQCKDKHNIDDMVPSFIEVAFLRLSREVKTSELRTMCLQVGIAAMFYNSNLFFTTLQNSSVPGVEGSLIKHFVGQWLYDTDCFNGLHDRKLCVLGLCQLMTIMPDCPDLIEYAPKIFPSLVMLFDGLKRAYEAAKEDDDSDGDSDEEDEDEDADQNILSSDEDEIDEESAVYLESLQDKLNKHVNGNMSIRSNIEEDEDSDEDEDEWDYDETALESFTTPLDDEDTAPDEYQIFQTVVAAMEAEKPDWYSTLTSGLTPENVKSIQEVFKLSEQRQAARRSKNIEKAGGYQFSQQSVPGQFNFAPNSGPNFTFGGN